MVAGIFVSLHFHNGRTTIGTFRTMTRTSGRFEAKYIRDWFHPGPTSSSTWNCYIRYQAGTRARNGLMQVMVSGQCGHELAGHDL